ncbi:MAG: hypothetical protein AB1896_05580 [Thermodesulfobacteriota bacterium]
MKAARSLALLLALLLLLAGPPAAWPAEESAFVHAPPVEYLRPVQIWVTDLGGNPLPGVRAEITPLWCRLVAPGELVSDERGRLEFQVQPVAENPLAGKRVTDRFLTYRAVFLYRLFKEGYLEKIEEIEDRQEFAAFSHPLYYGLDRRPDEKPLVIEAALAAYRDFLAGPGQPGLEKLVAALLEEGPAANIELAPRSLALDREGRLKIGLSFPPLFDPERYGLIEAGDALLREPVRDCLEIVRVVYPGFGEVKVFEIEVTARFQYRRAPFPEAVPRTYLFRLPAAAAARVLEYDLLEGPGFPYQDITVAVEGRNLDLAAGRASPETRR